MQKSSRYPHPCASLLRRGCWFTHSTGELLEQCTSPVLWALWLHWARIVVCAAILEVEIPDHHRLHTPTTGRLKARQERKQNGSRNAYDGGGGYVCVYFVYVLVAMRTKKANLPQQTQLVLSTRTPRASRRQEKDRKKEKKLSYTSKNFSLPLYLHQPVIEPSTPFFESSATGCSFSGGVSPLNAHSFSRAVIGLPWRARRSAASISWRTTGSSPPPATAARIIDSLAAACSARCSSACRCTHVVLAVAPAWKEGREREGGRGGGYGRRRASSAARRSPCRCTQRW